MQATFEITGTFPAETPSILTFPPLGREMTWSTNPGAPPVGGEFIVVRGDMGSVLQGEKHYHANPRLQMVEAVEAFEIRLRLRPKTARSGGTHINIMMHPTQGRTTVGLYFQESNLSIWENKNGKNIGEKHRNFDRDFTGWHNVHVIVANQVVEVRIDEGLPIRYESPRARPISLTNFNLEVLSSSVQFDDVLVISRQL